MLEDVMPPDEQKDIITRAWILDAIQRVSRPDSPHHPAIFFHVMEARRLGVTDDEIKDAMRQGVEGAE